MKKFTEAEINSVKPTEIQKHYNKNPIPAFELENHYLQAEELNKIVETLDLNSKIVKVLMQQTNQLVDYNASEVLGSIYTTQNLFELNALPNGVYRASTSGMYAFGLEAKEGYLTSFRKKGLKWTLESEVKIDSSSTLVELSDVEADFIADRQFLVGKKGKAIFRKIEFSDLNGKELDVRTFGTAVPAWNHVTKSWTTGYIVSSSLWTGSSMNRSTMVLRDSNGRFQANCGQEDYDVAVVGQIPYKLFDNSKQMKDYLDNKFSSYGHLVFDREYGKLYIVNKDGKSFKALLDQDGNVGSFLNLSDTPKDYSNSEGKFLKVKSSTDGVQFQFLTGSDFNINENEYEYLPIWVGKEWKKNGYVVSDEVMGSTIAKRTDDGRVKVAEPIDEDDAIPLSMFNEMFDEYIRLDGRNLNDENKQTLQETLGIKDVLEGLQEIDDSNPLEIYETSKK